MEEGIKQSLSKILVGMIGAIKNLSLYPENHPAVLKSLDQVFGLFQELFKSRQKIVMTIVDEVLVFEGIPFYHTQISIREIQKQIEDRGINTVEFKDLMSQQELAMFLELLLEDAESVRKHGAGELLKQREVKSIVVKDAREVYVKAVDTVSDVLQEARLGRIPQANKAKEAVTDLTEFVLSDRPALLALTLIKNYDNYLFNHSVNVSVLSLALAEALKVPRDDLNDIGLAGLLHDIGKTITPKEITLKPHTLSDEEWRIMQEHPVKSAEIVEKMEGVSDLTVRIVYEHHIKFDRTGYPDLEEGRQVHPYSKIVTVADCYDAITTLRPYQKPFPPREAMRILESLSGKVIDPKYFQEFIKILGIYPIGTLVRLHTNEVAVVLETNAVNPLKPKIRVVFDPEGNPLPKFFDLDLSTILKESPESRDIVSTVDPLLYNVDPSTLITP